VCMCVVLEFELKASCLQSRHSLNHLNHTSVHIALVILEIGSNVSFFPQAGLEP
jgi:hypothetical protein